MESTTTTTEAPTTTTTTEAPTTTTTTAAGPSLTFSSSNPFAYKNDTPGSTDTGHNLDV